MQWRRSSNSPSTSSGCRPTVRAAASRRSSGNSPPSCATTICSRPPPSRFSPCRHSYHRLLTFSIDGVGVCMSVVVGNVGQAARIRRSHQSRREHATDRLQYCRALRNFIFCMCFLSVSLSISTVSYRSKVDFILTGTGATSFSCFFSYNLQRDRLQSLRAARVVRAGATAAQQRHNATERAAAQLLAGH